MLLNVRRPGQHELRDPGAGRVKRTCLAAGPAAFKTYVGHGLRHSAAFGHADNFGSQGLTRTNDVWSNQLPGLSTDRIELTTSANLGSITLNPEGGCE